MRGGAGAAAFAREVERLSARSYAVEQQLLARLLSVKVSSTYRGGLERLIADAELEASRMKALREQLRSGGTSREALAPVFRFFEADGGCHVPRHAIGG